MKNALSTLFLVHNPSDSVIGMSMYDKGRLSLSCQMSFGRHNLKQNACMSIKCLDVIFDYQVS